MKTVNPTQLRANLYRILDQILASGHAIEIDRFGKKLLLSPLEEQNKLSRLKYRPNFISGNPEDLVDIHWEKHVKLSFP